jgi:apoptosis-inducing factor 3
MADPETNRLPDLASWKEAALAPEAGKVFVGHVGDDRVIVCRRDGLLKAWSATCPHLSAPLDEGIVTGGLIRCPWHHARFDLATGAAQAAPAFDDLTEYPVTLDGDRFCVKPSVAQPPRRAIKNDPGGDAMVIVGGGAAGFAAADALRRLGWRGKIAMVSSEVEPPYDRTLLTKDYLDGNFGDERLPIARNSLGALGVDFRAGVEALAIDRKRKRVRLVDGSEVAYAKLLLATGAEPRRPELPGGGLPHVMTLRSLADCRRILANVQASAKVAVVGGSFIALEAAASLRSRGLSVVVVAPDAHPLETVFGRALSDLVVKVHLDKGVRLHLNSKVIRIEPSRVHLEDGRALDADIVIVGAGVESRVDLARTAGLALDRGISVDSHMRTSDPNIFAAGDIARWPDVRTGEPIRVEHWVVAERQGQAAAANMLGLNRPFRLIEPSRRLVGASILIRGHQRAEIAAISC